MEFSKLVRGRGRGLFSEQGLSQFGLSSGRGRGRGRGICLKITEDTKSFPDRGHQFFAVAEVKPQQEITSEGTPELISMKTRFQDAEHEPLEIKMYVPESHQQEISASQNEIKDEVSRLPSDESANHFNHSYENPVIEPPASDQEIQAVEPSQEGNAANEMNWITYPEDNDQLISKMKNMPLGGFETPPDDAQSLAESENNHARFGSHRPKQESRRRKVYIHDNNFQMFIPIEVRSKDPVVEPELGLFNSIPLNVKPKRDLTPEEQDHELNQTIELLDCGQPLYRSTDIADHRIYPQLNLNSGRVGPNGTKIIEFKLGTHSPTVSRVTTQDNQHLLFVNEDKEIETFVSLTPYWNSQPSGTSYSLNAPNGHWAPVLETGNRGDLYPNGGKYEDEFDCFGRPKNQMGHGSKKKSEGQANPKHPTGNGKRGGFQHPRTYSR